MLGSNTPPRSPRHRWIIPAVIAALLFLGGVAGNLVAADLDPVRQQYRVCETRRAIEFYEQALEVFREIGDQRGEGNALGNLGNAYDALGETRRAVGYYQQQMKIVRGMGDHFGEGGALFNTGLALDKLGDRENAIAYVEAALEMYEQIESPYAERARAQLARWRGEM